MRYIIGIALIALLAMLLTHYNLKQTRQLLSKQQLEEKYWQYYVEEDKVHE